MKQGGVYRMLTLQFAQSNTRPKIAKELFCLPTLFLPTQKQNRDRAKIENEVVLNKKN